MATPRDVITRALKLIGVVAQGETPTADQLNDGFETLNELLGDWSTQNLLIHSETTEDLTFVAGQQTYTVGASGNLNTTRPQEIKYIKFKDDSVSPSYEAPINILTLGEWRSLSSRETQSDQPTDAYINYGYPFVQISFYPTPSGTKKASITSYKAFNEFATVNDSINMPDGYIKALRYSLACELAPEYGLQPSPKLESEAMRVLGNIKRRNKKTEKLTTDPFLTASGGFDWNTGE